MRMRTFQFQQVQFRGKRATSRPMPKSNFNSNRCNSESHWRSRMASHAQISIPTGAIQSSATFDGRSVKDLFQFQQVQFRVERIMGDTSEQSSFQFQQVQFRVIIGLADEAELLHFNSNRCNSEPKSTGIAPRLGAISIPTGAIQSQRRQRGDGHRAAISIPTGAIQRDQGTAH